MANLFEELRKRHVIRVAGMYAVAGWLAIEVGMALETTLNLPDWFDTLVTVLVLIGFPIALILAWAFDITPEGIQRTPADAGGPPAKGGRSLDVVIIAGLVAVAGVATWQALRKPIEETTTATATIATPVAEAGQSIAVLPFEAFSSNQDDAFFGKGISEELLNSLAKFPTLKVVARTSAFSFAGQDIDLREVGEKLGVAHVLQGSVRRSGDKLRITAALSRAADGVQVWSETYNRQMTDIFEIQDDIVAELSQVLQFRLGVGIGTGRAPNSRTTPQAYEMYLKGLDLWWERDANETNRADAITTFLRTTQLDPNFADAWAAYANSVALSSSNSWPPHLTVEDMPADVSKAYAKTLELEADNVRALAGLGYWHSKYDIDLSKSRSSLERAVAIAPTDGFVHYMTAQFAATIGDDELGARAMRHSLELDPLNATKHRVGFSYEVARGTFDMNNVFVRNQREELESCIATKSCTVREIGTGRFFLVVPAIVAGSPTELATLRELVTRAASEGRDAAVPANSVAIFTEEEACDVDLMSFLSELQITDWPTRDCLLKNIESDGGEDLLWVSVLARAGFESEAIDELFAPESLLSGSSSIENEYALRDGPLQMPESIRRHPRYHEWWARPGLDEIAALRRANGQDGGLPLPIESP